MKYIISIMLAVLCFGCSNARRPAQDKTLSALATDTVYRCTDSLAVAYKESGKLKSTNGDKHGAIADYTKAIELQPDNLSAYINRGVTKYKMGDYGGEIADYRLALRNCVPSANLYNNLGRALYDLKRFKESAEAYGEGIAHFPEDYKLYYGRGLARNQSGDKKGACQDWRKSSALGCFEANALLTLCENCQTKEE